jgi:hypothetical protein
MIVDKLSTIHMNSQKRRKSSKKKKKTIIVTIKTLDFNKLGRPAYRRQVVTNKYLY